MSCAKIIHFSGFTMNQINSIYNRQEDNEIIQKFFDGWYLYRAIIENDYMFHKPMFQEISKLFSESFADKGFSLLDLGCGDADLISQQLADRTQINYTAIDITKAALDLAKANFAKLAVNANFIHEDILTGMNNLFTNGNCYDVIFSSYALHHYQSEEKQQFFNMACQLLNPNGILVVLDIFREENHSREDYLNIAMQYYYDSLTTLSHEERMQIKEHIDGFDFPEKQSTLLTQIKNAGFTNPKIVKSINTFSLFQAKKL